MFHFSACDQTTAELRVIVRQASTDLRGRLTPEDRRVCEAMLRAAEDEIADRRFYWHQDVIASTHREAQK